MPRRTTPLLAAFALVCATAAALMTSGAASASASPRTTTVQVPRTVCPAATRGHPECDAIRLVTRHVSLAKASRMRADGAARPKAIAAVADGPAGGYSPAQLATAYGVNSAASTTATVAIVDAFSDPTVAADLDSFDAEYGLPAETASSFNVVNQTGGSTLPTPNTDWAGEISLDVEAVRGICHECKILLVEATDNSWPNLGAAAAYAAAHATIVSNSYGGPDTDSTITSAVTGDYADAGVALLASTGDAGWYGWDYLNEREATDGAPSFPSSDPDVVGVGGTTLALNPDNTRAAESTWDDDGPYDSYGYEGSYSYGASGGGCSSIFTAPSWQAGVSDYGTLGCTSGGRSAVDIAADADYFTGFDVCQNYGNTNTASCGWYTIGGTSLSSPLVAAMWGLEGGPQGGTPALTLYGHYKGDSSHPLYDVTVGGNGMCGTASPTECAGWWGTANPNLLGAGDIDCSFDPTTTALLADRYQCNAEPGYDGVSGVGTPVNDTVFKPMSPKAVITVGGTVTHNKTHTFSAAKSSTPFPGDSLAKYVWSWGDGKTTTTTSATATHKYSTKGTKTVKLTVTDADSAINGGRTGSTSSKVTVK